MDSHPHVYDKEKNKRLLRRFVPRNDIWGAGMTEKKQGIAA